MLNQYLVGGLTSIANIAIHALVMTLVVYAAHAVRAKQKSSSSLMVTSVMIATVSILMVAHACEVLVWALTYRLVSAAPAEADLVYFAFVNYTTLGYGDLIPVEDWKLLGPMTAMNGVLLFGWSTAVIFEVLRKAMASKSVTSN
jgi:Ion channel